MSAISTLFAFVYRQARGLVGLAILVGLVSGAAGAAQVAVLNMAIAGGGSPQSARLSGPAGSPARAGSLAPGGSRGPAGSPGPAESRGPAGSSGPAGSPGPTGSPGPAESRGPAGSSGPAGSAALPGWHGLAGRWLLVGAFVFLLFAAPATRLVSQFLLVKLGQDMLYELRLRLARCILSSPLPRLEQLGPGKLLVALTDDTAVITEALIVIPEVASNSALFVGGMVYLGWLSPALLGVFLLFLIPVLVAYRLPIGSSFERYRQAREEQDTLYGYFNGITFGAKELKLNRDRRAAYLRQLAVTAGALRTLFSRANLTLAGVVAGGWTFFMAAVGVIVFLAPLFTQVGREALVGYVLVLLYIRGPLQQVITNFSQLGRGGVAIGKLDRLGLELRRENEPEAPEGASRRAHRAHRAPGDAGWRSLELAGVTFTFPREAGEADFVLGPIDLTLRPGELVFLIGGNGSGKTSFAKLLTGLYEPAAGEIRWNGEPVGRATLDRYRQNFSAVFFDFHLFEDLPGAGEDGLDERSRRYLRELQLEDKVEIAGGRLSTTALSQGQRKRLALLSVYLEDRPLYLFDEWAADQDPYYKEVFYRRLLPRLKAEGKTVLVISHDDRYFDVADRVVRFSEGQVVWDGPVHDLAELRQAMLADCAPVPAGE